MTHEWWRGATIYQIYPRSFADSNGDGVGDLPGIAARLDHVASLGVDAVWLSPFFRSPMHDYGYDVADYCDVDPMFGTLADFDALLAKAHGLGLKVIIDQVYSHTSSEHPWFTESRSSRDTPRADWYVWADPKPDGSPPSNWQSVFGGPAWTWDARRGQYYMHNFLSTQPQLNGHNPAVQDALLAAGRFWLDRGVDGFRLDALNFAMHDRRLTDNPPVPACSNHPRTRPFDFQQHIHNMSQPEVENFIERIRALMDEYPGSFTVAEVGGPKAEREMKAFTRGDNRLNTAYGFNFLYAPDLTAERVARAMAEWPGGPQEGWPSWAFSNHDAPRAVSRWYHGSRPDAYCTLINLLLLSLRGNAFLWQGDELGLSQATIPFERLRDPEAIANWPLTLGRDGARTPLPWTPEAPWGGFSSVEPWLPMPPEHLAHAVAVQEADAASVLHALRRAIALRKHSSSLKHGAFRLLKAEGELLAFVREAADETMLCVFNLGEGSPEYAADGAWETVHALEGASSAELALPPLGAYVARKVR